MALIDQILQSEGLRDAAQIRLWQEGIFYKAYETSAYLFVSQIRAYAPRKRHYKSAGRSVVSIGFPMSALASLPLPSGAELLDAPDGKLIRLPQGLDLAGYEAWHSSVAEPSQKEDKPSVGVSTPSSFEDLSNELIRRLSSFRLESATPLDCMSFVAELRDLAISRLPR